MPPQVSPNIRDSEIIETIISENLFSEESIHQALIVFSEYKEKGVIKDCTFSDNKWNTYDELSDVGLRFTFDRLSYERYYRVYIHFDEFVNYVKAYILFHMDELVLASQRNLLGDVKKLVSTDPEKIILHQRNPGFVFPLRLSDFLSMLPVAEEKEENLEELIDSIDFLNEIRLSKQRELPSISSFFRMQDIMEDFWKNETVYSRRLFYAPVYFWWRITMTLPTRPREFILTPRDCLERKKTIDTDQGTSKESYYLKLKKSGIKGRFRKKTHKKDSDYYVFGTYIPDDLGGDIEKYIKATENTSELDTLFSTEPHYMYWSKKKTYRNRYYTYINLNTALRYFFKEIVEKRYGIRVVDKIGSPVLKENEIHRIHLGDTRPMSMINIIMDGGTPVLTMMLAGHSDIDISSFYYENLDEYVKCAVYRKYCKLIGGRVEYSVVSQYSPFENKLGLDLPDGGKCYSEKYWYRDYSDCLSVTGPNGELMYCPKCFFYRSSENSHVIDSESIYKKSIKDNCTYIRNAFMLYNRGQDVKEDVLRELLKLKEESLSYMKFLEERMLMIQSNQTKKAENRDGKS